MPPEVQARRVSILEEFGEYFLGLIAARRREPGDDLLSALIAVEDQGDSLSEDELALEDIEMGGVTVAQGDQVMLLLASANRDERHVADGERFDVARSEIRHLSFAFGPHFCLGAPLARAEAQLALATLAGRFPDLRLAGADLTYRDTLVLRGLEALPVEFEGKRCRRFGISLDQS